MAEKLYSIILTSAPFLQDAVIHFVESYPERISEIVKANQEKDFAGVQKAAHKLKGAAGTHGYPPVSEYARKLQKAAEDQNESEVNSLIDELKAYENRMVPEAP